MPTFRPLVRLCSLGLLATACAGETAPPGPPSCTGEDCLLEGAVCTPSSTGDAWCYQVDAGPTVDIVEAAAANPYGADPAVVGYHETTDDLTVVLGAALFSGVLDDPRFASGISIELTGAPAATRFGAASGAFSAFELSDSSGTYVGASRAGSPGLVDMATAGVVGDRLIGTFGVDACLEGPMGADCSTLINVKGAFNVARELDDWNDDCTVDALAAGADTACYTVERGVFTEVEAAAANAVGFDPIVLALANPRAGGFSLAVGSGFTAVTDEVPYAQMLIIDLSAPAPGTYTVGGMTNAVRGASLGIDGVAFGAGDDGMMTVGSGSVVLSANGAMGGNVLATFDLQLCRETMSGFDCADTLHIKGAFDGVRAPDGWVPECGDIAASAAGRDAMCWVIEGAGSAPTTWVEAVATNPFGGDPVMVATVWEPMSVDETTLLAGGDGFLRLSPSPTFTDSLNISFNGQGAGTYALSATGLDNVELTRGGGTMSETVYQARWADSGMTAEGEAVLVVTDFPGASGMVVGHLSSELCRVTAMGLDCGDTIEVSATVHITREDDDWHNGCVASAASAGADVGCFTLRGGLVELVEASAANPFGFDPGGAATLDLGSGELEIVMVGGFVSAMSSPPFDQVVSLQLSGDTAGTYSLGGMPNAVLDATFEYFGEVYRADPAMGGQGTASVDLSDGGSGSGQTTGTFDLELCKEDSMGMLDCNDTIRLTGAFDVTREPDGWVPECAAVDPTVAPDVACGTDGSTTTILTETIDATNAFGLDPAVVAIAFDEGTMSESTILFAGGGFLNLFALQMWTTELIVELPSVSTGTFDLAAGEVTRISVTSDGGTVNQERWVASYDPMGPTVVGTAIVSIPTYGTVGQRVVALIEAELCLRQAMGPPDCSNPMRLNIVLGAEREPNDIGQICTVTGGVDELCFVRNGAVITLAETAAGNPFGGDALTLAWLDHGNSSDPGSLLIGGFENFTAVTDDPPFTTAVILVVDNNGLATYDLASMTDRVHSVDLDYAGQSLGARGGVVPEGTGTVTITDDGSGTGRVTGTYDLRLCTNTGTTLDCTDTFNVAGSFDMAREADGYPPGCDGIIGGGGADTLCVLVSGDNVADRVVATEVVDATNPYGYAPVVLSTVLGGSTTLVGAGLGWRGALLPSPGFANSFSFELTGTTPGIYFLDDNSLQRANLDIDVGGMNELRYSARSAEGEGWVEVSAFGAAGNPVQGTYRVDLCRETPMGRDCNDQVRAQGAFDATRDVDDFNQSCAAGPMSLCYVFNAGLMTITDGGAMDPWAFAEYSTGGMQTLVAAGEGANGMVNPPFDHVVSLEFPGQMTGAAVPTSIRYRLNGQFYADDMSAGPNTVNVMSYGGIGTTVAGNFDVRVCAVTSAPMMPVVTDCMVDEINIAGDFDVIRAADAP